MNGERAQVRLVANPGRRFFDLGKAGDPTRTDSGQLDLLVKQRPTIEVVPKN